MNKKMLLQFKGKLERSDWTVIHTGNHKVIHDTYHKGSDESPPWCATLVEAIKGWEKIGWTSPEPFHVFQFDVTKVYFNVTSNNWGNMSA